MEPGTWIALSVICPCPIDIIIALPLCRCTDWDVSGLRDPNWLSNEFLLPNSLLPVYWEKVGPGRQRYLSMDLCCSKARSFCSMASDSKGLESWLS